MGQFGFKVALATVCALFAHVALAQPGGVTVGPTGPVAPQGAPPVEASADDKGADVRRGLVAIEQGGKISGVGIVLGTDGRILTSLSALSGDEATVKLPDGRNAKARVGHKDKASDLALLILQSGKWTDGLRASEVDPSSVSLRAVASTQAGRATTLAATLRGRVDVRSKDGQSPLAGALDVELPKGATALAGAPLLDDKGSVMGVFIRACKPGAADAGANAKCAAGWVGAPVAWIRSFLSKTPAEAIAPSPWLGLAGETGASGATSGVRILAVAPQSPAEKAGLKGNSDRAKATLIVAVDGTPVATPEKLAEAIGHHAVGDSVKLLVLEGEKLRELAVTLRAAP
jgi:serine protease Do